MATRKELQEWLNRFPEETIIEVGIQQEAGHYQSYGCVSFDKMILEDNDIGNGWEFTDFRNNKFVKPDADHYKKCILTLGEAM